MNETPSALWTSGPVDGFVVLFVEVNVGLRLIYLSYVGKREFSWGCFEPVRIANGRNKGELCQNLRKLTHLLKFNFG